MFKDVTRHEQSKGNFIHEGKIAEVAAARIWEFSVKVDWWGVHPDGLVVRDRPQFVFDSVKGKDFRI